MVRTKKRIGEILLYDMGVISGEQLDIALSLKSNGSSNLKLGDILVAQGFCEQKDVTKALSLRYDIPVYEGIDKYEIPKEVKNLIPIKIIRKYKFIPLRIENNKLHIVISDVHSVDDIKFSCNYKLTPFLADIDSIDTCIELNYGKTDEFTFNFDGSELMVHSKETSEDIPSHYLKTKATDTSIVRLTASLLNKAISIGATDIHLEPKRNNVEVKYRKDGNIIDGERYGSDLHISVTVRFKVISGLDITKRRLPQDGSFYAEKDNQDYTFRVSTLPTVFGEKIVIRILHHNKSLLNLSDLGMPKDIAERTYNFIDAPQGMLLVTGPTGSGKTTTIYSCLNQIKSNRNVVTIEDPVEYHIQKYTQSQIDEAVGRTFPVVLRSVLRQDPDVILVGEIRDLETADIALKSALTGHLVFSTLHTNSAVETIRRLINMGIPQHEAASVSGVIAQRLVRKICPNCISCIDNKEQVKGMTDGIDTFYFGAGCSQCGNTGYRGVVAVYEFLQINNDLRVYLQQAGQVTEDEIAAIAKKSGYKPMWDCAIDKVKQGITTIEEVIAKIPYIK